MPYGTLVKGPCGRQFFFARDFVRHIQSVLKNKSKHNFEQYPISAAVDYCCSIGMRMVSVENAAKKNCLADIMSKNTSKNFLKEGFSRNKMF
jgi:hypothetical protein